MSAIEATPEAFGSCCKAAWEASRDAIILRLHGIAEASERVASSDGHARTHIAMSDDPTPEDFDGAVKRTRFFHRMHAVTLRHAIEVIEEF